MNSSSKPGKKSFVSSLECAWKLQTHTHTHKRTKKHSHMRTRENEDKKKQVYGNKDTDSILIRFR